MGLSRLPHLLTREKAQKQKLESKSIQYLKQQEMVKQIKL